jgi:hypothetical protein
MMVAHRDGIAVVVQLAGGPQTAAFEPAEDISHP